MSVPPSRFSSIIPSWMSEAYGRPSPAEGMQWLLAAMCQQLGADACLVVRVNGAGTHGAVAWSHGASMDALSHELLPLGSSATAHILASPTPLPVQLTSLAGDPWLADRGIIGGAMVALQQGPVRFGSLGLYFTREDAELDEALALLAEIRLLLWPLLCWQMLGAEMELARSPQPGAPSAVHRANNILSNIVLLTDLALAMPSALGDEGLRLVLQRIASEGVRCADVLRDFGPE